MSSEKPTFTPEQVQALVEAGRRQAEEEAKRQATGQASSSPSDVAGGVIDGMASVAGAAVEGVADAASSGCCLAAASFDGPDCFVATASLGTDRHQDLTSLRTFRDTVLRRSWLGTTFVRFYYRWGRHAANAIRGRAIPCFLVREFIVRPAARAARWIMR